MTQTMNPLAKAQALQKRAQTWWSHLVPFFLVLNFSFKFNFGFLPTKWNFVVVRLLRFTRHLLATSFLTRLDYCFLLVVRLPKMISFRILFSLADNWKPNAEEPFDLTDGGRVGGGGGSREWWPEHPSCEPCKLSSAQWSQFQMRDVSIGKWLLVLIDWTLSNGQLTERTPFSVRKARGGNASHRHAKNIFLFTIYCYCFHCFHWHSMTYSITTETVNDCLIWVFPGFFASEIVQRIAKWFTKELRLTQTGRRAPDFAVRFILNGRASEIVLNLYFLYTC